MTRRLQLLAILLLVNQVSLLSAAEVLTRVEYLAADAIYIDAGSGAGIQLADRVEIRRDGILIARLEVVFVAENSASCKVIEEFQTLRLGDTALVTVETAAVLSLPEKVVAETYPDEIRNLSHPLEGIEEDVLTPHLSGRVGLQYNLQDDLDEFDYDYRQPTMLLHLQLQNLFSTNHNLNLRMRLRRNLRDQTSSINSEDAWNNRFYEVSLTYDNASSPWSYQIGRISSRQVSSIGSFDGLLGEYRFTPNWTVGLLAGTQPDLQNTRPQTDETKGGVYAIHEGTLAQSVKFASTVALVGRYVRGNISREFVYQQLNMRFGRSWGLYQSAEVGVNRGWRQETADGTLSLSNILLNLRYTPTRVVSASLGYDTRTILRTFATRDTPDSLFDDAYRQGLRTALSLRLPQRLQITLGGGLRFTGGEDLLTRSFYGGIGQHDILHSGLHADLRISGYRNLYTTGWQPTLRISRLLLQRLNTALQIGQNRYNLNGRDEQLVYNWIRLKGDTHITKTFYLSLAGEIYRGNSQSTNRVFLEFGVRL